VKKEPSPGARDRAWTLRRTMTEAERRLWQMLRSRQTQGWRFRRQVPIGRFIADFVCHEARLIVEIDGGQHDPSAEAETGRTRFLEGEGYRVLRFWSNEVLDNPEGVRSAITENLQRDHPGGYSAGHPHPTLPHRGGGMEAASTPSPSMGEDRRRRAPPPVDGGDLEAASTPSPSMGEGRGGGDDAENRRLREELREALARETAMAEVLQVINSSPGDLAPIFDTILEKAHSLCGVAQGALLLREGEQFRLVALHAEPRVAEYWRQLGPLRSRPDDPVTQPMRAGQVLHFADVLADDWHQKLSPEVRRLNEIAGMRTLLMVPLRRNEVLLGVITAFRQEVRPFSDEQIALLQNFAAQAVIAMENARLLTETREALVQQTATAEILQVINSSPGDRTPVFEAILEKVRILCGATHGSLSLSDGGRFRMVAINAQSQELSNRIWRMRQEFLLSDFPHLKPLLDGARLVHVPDLLEFGNPFGARTGLFVALRKDDALLGVIATIRHEIRPFSDKEIALVENFAAQAVIAMENARLLGELRQRTTDLEQSLEYQTATSDVLQVVSRSTFDLQPVLDTLIGTAARLCHAELGHIAIRDGDVYRPLATFAISPERDAYMRTLEFKADNTTVVGRTVSERKVIHVADVQTDAAYASSPGVVSSYGLRTGLGAPLLRQGEPIGAIMLGRLRVDPFTERQIKLVGTFADQAVIAIENTRLITETREALEQQTATAEVLQVINSSPGDLAPVFESILEKAHSLCDASYGALWSFDGESFRAIALHSVPQGYAEFITGRPFQYAPGRRSGIAQIADGKDFAHFLDVAADQDFQDAPGSRAVVELGGARTMLVVALRKEGTLLGAITAYRKEVRPFTGKQIALLQNFAAQAVIAMENARLLTETREALEQQTATAEVLQVINASQGDLAPVFDSMLEKAMRLWMRRLVIF